MHLDVLDLRAFYYRTKLGRSAQRALQDALRGLWPETRGMTVVRASASPRRCCDRSWPTRAASIALMPAQQGVMPWPVGAPERQRPRRGDPLADRDGNGRPPDRRPRARDLRAARRAPRRDLARAGAAGPGGLHRAQPLRPVGAARRHALRLRPALQLRPARGDAAPAPPRARAPRRRALRARRRTGASGCRRRISGSASAVASIRISSPGRCWSRRPSRSTPGPRTGREGRAFRGPLEVLEGLARPSPSRSPDATPSPSASGPASALNGPGGARARRCGAPAYCHPAIPLLSPRRFHRGVSCLAAAAHALSARLGGRVGNGRVVVASSASLTSGVAGRYATALFEIAREAAMPRRGRAPI